MPKGRQQDGHGRKSTLEGKCEVAFVRLDNRNRVRKARLSKAVPTRGLMFTSAGMLFAPEKCLLCCTDGLAWQGWLGTTTRIRSA